MQTLSRWLVGLVASPLGVLVLGALDSTVFNWLPFGIDTAVVLLSARKGPLAWTVVLLATLGSVGGAALTFWMGTKIGEKGLERHLSPRRSKAIRSRIRRMGAIPLALLDLIPPPFPFTPFVLAAGALGVDAPTFFITLVVSRLLRFGTEALLAALYGPRILGWMDSDIFHDVVGGCMALAILASIVSIVRLVRANHSTTRRAAA